jgi:hypothetical protein
MKEKGKEGEGATRQVPRHETRVVVRQAYKYSVYTMRGWWLLSWHVDIRAG